MQALTSSTTSHAQSTLRSRASTLYSLFATRYLLLVMVGLGGVLRLVGLTRQGFWTDELYVVWEARQPLDMIFDPALHIQHPPGYRLALHIWMGLGGTGEFWLRLLPALSGILLIAVVWALARELWPSRLWAAACASLFVATSPFLVHYSQDVTTYSWTALWVTLSVWLLLRAWREDRLWLWAAWGVSLSVSLYSHYFAVFPVSVEVSGIIVLGVLRQRQYGRATVPRLAHAGLALVGAGLLYAPWVVILFTRGAGSIPSVSFPLTADAQPLGWLPALIAGYAHPEFWQRGMGEWLAWGLAGAGLLWAGRGLWRTKSARGTLGAALALVWFGAAIIGPYLFLRRTTPPDAVTPVRFAALAAPPIMLGLGMLAASLNRWGRLLLLSGWLLLSGVQLYREYVAPPKQDWRGVMSIVAREAQPEDVMLAFTAFHAGAAAAYYPIPLPVKGGWFVREGVDPAGAGYWFKPGWRWRGFLDTDAYRSADFRREFKERTNGAYRLWYLAGDNTDGTYPPSPAAERTLLSLGWRLSQEWSASPLVLKLYMMEK